jgi:hypothetical protein
VAETPGKDAAGPVAREGGRTDSKREVRMGPLRGIGVPATYVILIALMLYATFRSTVAPVPVWAGLAVVTLLLVYLVRELSVFYVIDRRYLRAMRLFGWRKVRLSSIRKVELVSLRDLSPTGFSGLWGWRSRVWSPQIGRFDAIQTYHVGMLVHGQGVPLFISPHDRDEFMRTLVGRVRRTNPSVESPLDAAEGAAGGSSGE